MADIIVLIIIIGAAVLGYKRGLVRSVFNLGYHLIALIFAAVFYPVVTSAIKNTKLYTLIFDAVLKRSYNGNAASNLPKFLENAVASGLDAAAQNMAATITDLIVTILSIVIVFVAVKLILSIVSKVFNLFAKLPVIKSFNKFGGFGFGLLSGIVVVYVVLALLTVAPTSAATRAVTSGNISSQMYNNNAVLELIFK